MKNVGLLIINYNDSTNTLNLIKNVYNYTVINKIVVVDNKSTDNSYEVLFQYESDKIHIIQSEKNLGYSGAINLGSKYLIEEFKDCYIIISNTDVIIKEENDIIKLLNNFTNNVACVMPTIIEDGKYKTGWKLTGPTKDLLISIPIINRLYRNKLKNYSKKYLNSNNNVDVVNGCFFIIDSQTLSYIGLMDDTTFLYYEEYILARKLKNINRISVIDKDVYVEHKHNQTIKKNINRVEKYKIYKKSFLYYEKEYNKANIIHMLFFYLFYFIGLLLVKIRSLI